MISHLSFGVADLERSAAFYDAALRPLGIVRVWTTFNALGYGLPGGEDQLALKLQSEDVVAPGPGFHLAFKAATREAVDEFFAGAMAFGGREAGAPGLRPHYGPTYYAAFVLDPDGHKLEAVCQ